jgi:hypothetical protein
MRLKFEGRAVVDPQGGVRFAEQYESSEQPRIVIYRIDREALIAVCLLVEPTPAQLLGSYRSISTEVNRLASVQFDGGIQWP